MVVVATTGEGEGEGEVEVEVEVEVGGEVEGTIGMVATAMADKGMTVIFKFVQGKEYYCNFLCTYWLRLNS